MAHSPSCHQTKAIAIFFDHTLLFVSCTTAVVDTSGYQLPARCSGNSWHFSDCCFCYCKPHISMPRLGVATTPATGLCWLQRQRWVAVNSEASPKSKCPSPWCKTLAPAYLAVTAAPAEKLQCCTGTGNSVPTPTLSVSQHQQSHVLGLTVHEVMLWAAGSENACKHPCTMHTLHSCAQLLEL